MENNSEYFIVLEPSEDGHIELHKIIGKIELFDDKIDNAKVATELLKTGNYRISPFGFGEKDENGNITSFDLRGFNITRK